MAKFRYHKISKTKKIRYISKIYKFIIQKIARFASVFEYFDIRQHNFSKVSKYFNYIAK